MAAGPLTAVGNPFVCKSDEVIRVLTVAHLVTTPDPPGHRHPERSRRACPERSREGTRTNNIRAKAYGARPVFDAACPAAAPAAALSQRGNRGFAAKHQKARPRAGLFQCLSPTDVILSEAQRSRRVRANRCKATTAFAFQSVKELPKPSRQARTIALR